QTPIQREAALRALGNAGLKENVPLVLQEASSADESVRRGAAAALRKTPTAQTTPALIGLVSDPAPSVAGEALRSLSEHPVGASELDALAAQVLAGNTSRKNDPALVTFLAAHLEAGPSVTKMLEYLA